MAEDKKELKFYRVYGEPVKDKKKNLTQMEYVQASGKAEAREKSKFKPSTRAFEMPDGWKPTAKTAPVKKESK